MSLQFHKWLTKLAEQSQLCFFFLLSPHITQALLCYCRETDLHYDAPRRTWQKKSWWREGRSLLHRNCKVRERGQVRKEAAVCEVQQTAWLFPCSQLRQDDFRCGQGSLLRETLLWGQQITLGACQRFSLELCNWTNDCVNSIYLCYVDLHYDLLRPIQVISPILLSKCADLFCSLVGVCLDTQLVAL